MREAGIEDDQFAVDVVVDDEPIEDLFVLFEARIERQALLAGLLEDDLQRSVLRRQDRLHVRSELEAELEEMRLDERSVDELVDGERAMEQLPNGIIREVHVDHGVGVRQEEELVKRVAEFFRRRTSVVEEPCDVTRRPVTVDELPLVIDAHSRPTVPEAILVVVSEFHSWSIADALRDAMNQLYRKTCKAVIIISRR